MDVGLEEVKDTGTTPKVRRLHVKVVESIRSSFTISTQQQAIEELVLNSIDAGADSIDISVDAAKCSFEVRDNGTIVIWFQRGLVLNCSKRPGYS